jgi:hypothetical protein
VNKEAREIWALRTLQRPESKRCPLAYDDYRRYLRSGHWRRLRARIRSQRSDRCEVCGLVRGADLATGRLLRGETRPRTRVVLEVHHLTYERLGQERDEDLQLLCQSCHAGAHWSWDPF